MLSDLKFMANFEKSFKNTIKGDYNKFLHGALQRRNYNSGYRYECEEQKLLDLLLNYVLAPSWIKNVASF